MKKNIWITVFSFCLLFFVFSTVYYFSYRDLLQSQSDGPSQEEIRFETILAETESTEESAVEAGRQDEDTVTEKMLYISQNYDTASQIVTETIRPMPEAYIGKTREELIELLKQEDEGKSLVSFSSSRLVIRSEAAVDPEDYRFLLILEEGYLKVYLSDRSDVYLETYLTEEELPASERTVLKNGYYIKDVGALYDYLESITS